MWHMLINLSLGYVIEVLYFNARFSNKGKKWKMRKNKYEMRLKDKS